MSFQESKTWRNLQQAYEGELRASGKYGLYGELAHGDELENIARAYGEIGAQEREHAELFWSRLSGGQLPDALANLRDSAAGEFKEWTETYRRFAEEARQEGYHDVARLFERVAAVERHHNLRFCALADELEHPCGREEEAAWVCLNCGHVHIGRQPPRECPLCGKPSGWFRAL